MVLYYTGTGNSKIIAKTLAIELDDRIADAFEPIKTGKYEKYSSDTPWIFVSPTYAWRIPAIFERFIRSSEFDGCRDAYFVMTCGDSIGNAAWYIKKLCKDLGFNLRGVRQINMPENYTAMFDVPDKEQTEKIVKEGILTAKETASFIKKGIGVPKQAIGTADVVKSSIVNVLFNNFSLSAKKFYTKDNCLGCGMCEKLCPCNTIRIVGKRPSWGENCTHCMACINACPEKAIEYGTISQGKPRIYNGEAR